MPQVLGPYSLSSNPPLVLNTAVAINVDREARAIQIHNDSPYLLYIAFDGQQPTSLTSMRGEYDASVGPWGHPVIPIQRTAASARERMLNAIYDFNGTLWIMTIDPTGALAQTGSVSLLNMVHIDALLPGEKWPQSWAVPRQHDLTSQPRMVAVPISYSQFYTGDWSGVGTLDIVTFTPTAAQLAARLAPIYCYYGMFCPTPHTGQTVFALGMQWIDGGGANVGGLFAFCRGGVYCNTTNNTAKDYFFTPPEPFGAIGPMPANAVKAKIQLSNIGGTPIQVSYVIAVNMDARNITGVSDIGQNPFNAGSQPLY